MNVLRYTDLAFQVAGNIIAPPLLGIFFGSFLDQKFGTQPVFLLVLLFLGLATGIRGLFRLTEKIIKDK